MRLREFTYDSVTRVVTSTLALFSPGRAYNYNLSRMTFRSYTAGVLKGPNKNWIPRNKSGDMEIRRDKKLVMARCRDMARNNPYIKGILTKICNNVVRNGIRPQFQVKKADGTLDNKLNDSLESIWKRWSKKKYADISGHDSIGSIQKLILRHMWSDGECLIHRVWDKKLIGKGVVPFHLEVLECDMLDDRVDGTLGNGNIARQGIEINPATGRAVQYHIRKGHPGDFAAFAQDTIKIPAKEIIHVFEKDRASQFRGISWFAAIVMEAFDLGEYKSFERIGAKLAAAFGIFIKTSSPELIGSSLPPLGGGSGNANSVPGYKSDPIPEYIQPGRIQKLPVGTDISFASHNRPGDSYGPYIKESLRELSCGAGTSYSTFSNDYSDSSYSADRSAKLEDRLSYQGQQRFINEKFNEGLISWILEAVVLSNLENLPGYFDNSDQYEDAVIWQNPGWTWVDPLKDSKAAERDLEMGLTCHQKLAAAKGEDWEENIDALVRNEEKLMELNKLRARNKEYAKPKKTI